MIRVTPDISLPEELIEEKFIRSSGPGGQNVNKVATAVQLRFDAASAPLPHRVRARLIALAGARATRAGEIIIEADNHRTRERNREEALERLLELIRKAAVRPKPRKKTRPTRASQQRRVDAKKKRSGVKRTRGRVRADD